MIKKITLLVLIFSLQCFAQTAKNKPQLASDLMEENLKGPVKSYQLKVHYVTPYGRYNNANRIATPKGEGENVFAAYNKDGLLTKSLFGIYDDKRLELEGMDAKDSITYVYSDYDLIYKKGLLGRREFPSMLDSRFYTIDANRCHYYKNNPIMNSVHEIYGLGYNDDKKQITDRAFYRAFTSSKKLEGSEKEDLDDKNLKDKWHFEYDTKGLLRKIRMQRDSGLFDFIIKYFRYQLKRTLKVEILFDYDLKGRLIKYTVFSFKNDVKEEIGSVKYAYNIQYGFAETESIFYKYPDQYYLSNVHNYTHKYNKQGDLIASLLHVDPKDEMLVRHEQLYLDKFYEYTYDQNDNWIECRIRVNNRESEVSAIMERKIEYYTD